MKRVKSKERPKKPTVKLFPGQLLTPLRCSDSSCSLQCCRRGNFTHLSFSSASSVVTSASQSVLGNGKTLPAPPLIRALRNTLESLLLRSLQCPPLHGEPLWGFSTPNYAAACKSRDPIRLSSITFFFPPIFFRVAPSIAIPGVQSHVRGCSPRRSH